MSDDEANNLPRAGGAGGPPAAAAVGNRAGSGTVQLGGGPSDVFRVGVRVPPFWPDEPEVWFSQLESQFILSGITMDETKYHFVCGQLDPEYAVKVKDILRDPPATGKYIKLKRELIQRISTSREKKALQLLQHEEIGDRKPTEFLRHLQDLAGPHMPEGFIRTIWTSRLPPNVQTVVAFQPTLDLDTLAGLADKVIDVAQPSYHVASTSTGMPATALENRVAELTRQVESLLKVQGHGHRSGSFHHRKRSRSHSRQRSRSRSRQRPEGHPHCWYHFTFGSKASTCKQPCSYHSGNSQGSH